MVRRRGRAGCAHWLAVRALSQLKAMMSDIQKAKNMRVLIQKKLEEARDPPTALAPKPHPAGRPRAHASSAAARPVQCRARVQPAVAAQ